MRAPGEAEEQSELLLRKAAEDRAALEFPLSDSIYGFHAQQAIEKLLKSLVAALDLRYPLTHDLRELWTVCVDAGEQMPELSPVFLDLQDYAVTMRYDDIDTISEIDRVQVREIVGVLDYFVRSRLKQLRAG